MRIQYERNERRGPEIVSATIFDNFEAKHKTSCRRLFELIDLWKTRPFFFKLGNAYWAVQVHIINKQVSDAYNVNGSWRNVAYLPIGLLWVTRLVISYRVSYKYHFFLIINLRYLSFSVIFRNRMQVTSSNFQNMCPETAGYFYRSL